MTSKMKKFLIILAAIAAGSFVIAVSLFYSTCGFKPISSSTNDISQHEEIDISGLKKINILTIDTPVEITADEGNKVIIDFKGKVITNISRKLPELSVQKIREELKIEIIYPAVISFGLFDVSDLILEIKVPTDFTGGILTGTTSARINIDDIRASTISGAVKIKIPTDSSFNYDLSSVSGKIENNFKSVMTYADRQSVKGTVNTGDFEININTTYGMILLENN
ncbi:MAG TPA: hypothetical protein DCY00_00495 [Actinobacteria bacterium]|nr:hypothetical protein [Actinomycetota bacterium]